MSPPVGAFLTLILAPRAAAQAILQFSDRQELQRVLLDRNNAWAAMNGYEYRLESERKWHNTHSVYFEKIRMLAEALMDGTFKWALWLDDDATINRVDLKVEHWLDEFPNADFILAPQGALELHNVSIDHYYNSGVWLVRTTSWSRRMLDRIRKDLACTDLQVAHRVGNPEQDCLARLVYGVDKGTYPDFTPFAGIDPSPDTLAHIGEPHHTTYNCVGSFIQDCFPWIFHFQHAAKNDSKGVFLPQLQFGAVTDKVDPKNLEKPLTYRRFQAACEVVVVPTHGFANRMRMLASANIYAEVYGCSFKVLWEKNPAMPMDWHTLFKESFASPEHHHYLPGLVRPEHTVHTNAWVDSVNPFALHAAGEAVVFRGGHTFKLGAMSVAEYNRKKQIFYRRLVSPSNEFAGGVTKVRGSQASAPLEYRRVRPASLFNASGCACVHYRQTVPTFDAADKIDFDHVSPLLAFRARLATLSHPCVFVSSTSLEAKFQVMSWNSSRSTMFWDDGGGEFDPEVRSGDERLLFDWHALATCDLILGTHGSSFSDEAVHVYGTVKECIGFVDSPYHTYSAVENGVRFIRGYTYSE
jgi:hypothetical protein